MEKQQRIKISIIVPIYNTEDYLPRCLDSLLAQTLTDLEILCVDDGSTDSTPEILRRYAEADPRVHVFHQENKRQGAARNLALTQVQGEEAGLSEIEAFSKYPEPDGRYIKLMDREENFLYDYRTAPDGTGELMLYTHGCLPALTEEDYHIGITGGEGTAVLDDGVIYLSCPSGEEFVLNITCDAAGVSDSIYVRNPGIWKRSWDDFWQKAEEAVFVRYSREDQKKLQIISIPKKIAYVLRHLG